MTLKDELPRSVGAQDLLDKSGEIAPEGMERLNQSRKNIQLWKCLVVKVKSYVAKTILHRKLES